MSEYVSTRGACADEPRDFSDVLLDGLAPDRGLYVPTEYSHLCRDALLELNQLKYPGIFVGVRSEFVGNSLTYYQQQELAGRAYTTEKFPQVENEQYVPVRQIGRNLFIQNLSLGPTAAFKDMAMQALGQDMQFELQRRGETVTILGATSGDTGSAAEAALKSLSRVSGLYMLSPLNGAMSEVQRAQMAHLSGGNIHNITMDAPFGAMQDLVKDIKKDPEFSHLGAVNSINWARVASQVPYYFSGYLQTVRALGSEVKIGDEVDFVVPSGNMGNALAGYIARKMGLPIRKIIVATNENDVLHRLIQTGVYQREETVPTTSPSMDIDSASNYERVVHDLLDGNTQQTSRYMKQYEQAGVVEFADIGRDDINLKSAGLDSGTSNHGQRIETIRQVYRQSGDIIDPHTADGVGVALRRGTPEVPTICMETALPVKFESTIKEALGFAPAREERFYDIEQSLKKEESFITLHCSMDALKNYIRSV